MSGPVSIGSPAEWQTLLTDTNVVIADFYADWCGPCKMIAPHYERLAKEHSRPKKVAFAKVNVDTQSTIARTQGVAAMPTFKIFHGGNCVETIKGANPSALTEAITKAVALADSAASGKSANAFKSPGRTLGNEQSVAGSRGFDLMKILSTVIVFLGLYLVSLFSFDAMAAAENSRFNVHKRATDAKKAPRATGSAGSGPSNGAARQAQKPAFRTLADLGSE